MPLRFTDTITPERVKWLWPGYIPFGKVTVLDGDPGLGKSTILIDIAARLSRGAALPNGKQHTPMGTILLMGEDGAGDTIVPRLLNAEAELTRVAVRDTYPSGTEGQEAPPSFPADLDRLREDIILAYAGLVVIDPIMSYLDADINSNSDQHVRRALMPLATLAEETGAAIVLLRHLNKSSASSALYRGGGSIGFVGVARSGLIVARDPDDQTRAVLASTKSNLGPPPPSLVYRLVGCENGAAKVEWDGHSGHTATTLVQTNQDGGEGNAHTEACNFLRELLGDHLPLLSRELWRQVQEAGHARNTILRAKNTLGVVVEKARTQDGAWTWTLPRMEESHQGGVSNSSNSSNSLNSSDSSPNLSKNLNNLKSLKNPLLDEWDSSADSSSIAIPVAAASGRGYCCAVCQKPIFAQEGRPLLCSEHRAAMGAD